MLIKVKILFLALCFHVNGNASLSDDYSNDYIDRVTKRLMGDQLSSDKVKRMRFSVEDDVEKNQPEIDNESATCDSSDSSRGEDVDKENSNPCEIEEKDFHGESGTVLHKDSNGVRVNCTPGTKNARGVYAFVVNKRCPQKLAIDSEKEWYSLPDKYKTNFEIEYEKAIQAGLEDNKALHKVYLTIETRLLSYLKVDPAFMGKSIYVGETKKQICVRGKQHIKEVVKRMDTEESMDSIKDYAFSILLKSGNDLTQTSIVYGIPESNLLAVEALVESVLSCRLFGCSARIATKADWKAVEIYNKWSERTETLKQEGLLTLAEDLRNKLFQSQFGFLSQ